MALFTLFKSILEFSFTKLLSDQHRELNKTSPNKKKENNVDSKPVETSNCPPQIVQTPPNLPLPPPPTAGVGLIGPGDFDEEDPDQQLLKLLLQQGGNWICRACGRSGNRRDNMKRHVENVHLPRVLRCKLCYMLVRNRQTFYRHMKRKHGMTSMKETEQYKEDPCDPNSTGMRDNHGNPVGSYDDDDGDDETPAGSEHFLSMVKVEHAD